MTKLSRPILSTLIVLQAVMSLFAAVYVQAADKTSEPKVKVDDKSFKCITDMTPVRHFTSTVASTFPSRLWRLRWSARATIRKARYCS
jgi:hypothetical protein